MLGQKLSEFFPSNADGNLAGQVAGIAGRPDAAVQGFTLMKVVGRDVWIGIWVFVMALIAMTRWERTTGSGSDRVCAVAARNLINTSRLGEGTPDLFIMGQSSLCARRWQKPSLLINYADISYKIFLFISGGIAHCASTATLIPSLPVPLPAIIWQFVRFD